MWTWTLDCVVLTEIVLMDREGKKWVGTETELTLMWNSENPLSLHHYYDSVVSSEKHQSAKMLDFLTFLARIIRIWWSWMTGKASLNMQVLSSSLVLPRQTSAKSSNKDLNVSCMMNYVFTSALLRKAYVTALSPTDNRIKHVTSAHKWSLFMNIKYVLCMYQIADLVT